MKRAICYFKNILSIVIILIFLFPQIILAKKFGPWDTTLVQIEKKKKYKSQTEPSTLSNFLNIFIKFFQKIISPQDGPNCRYRPTCAKYAEICIKRYGPIKGIIMASDRFLRCNPFGAWGKDLPEDNYFFGDLPEKNTQINTNKK